MIETLTAQLYVPKVLKIERDLAARGYVCPITYNELDHSYIRTADGILYAGCSSVAGCFPKDYLAKWATKKNFEYMLANWDINRIYTEDEQWDLLTAAKSAYEREQKEAMRIGTKIHDWIESHIKGIDKPLDEETHRPIALFLEWEAKYIEEWEACELLVHSEEMRVAGRLDAVARFTNQLRGVVDYKTSNAISPEYALQTAGYSECLREMGVDIDLRSILRLPKTLTRKVYDPVTRRVSIEDNNLEFEIVPSDITEDVRIFKHMREVYPWVKANCNI